MRNSRIRLLIDIPDVEGKTPYHKGNEFDCLVSNDGIFTDLVKYTTAYDKRDDGICFFNIEGMEPEYEEIPITDNPIS